MTEKMPEKISACRDPQLKVCRWTEECAAPMACETQYIRLDKHQAELAALKAAVRDMAGALAHYRSQGTGSVGQIEGVIFGFDNGRRADAALTKHAALIEAEGN